MKIGMIGSGNAGSADRMGQAHEEPGRVGMPIAGDDEKALDIASTLIRKIAATLQP